MTTMDLLLTPQHVGALVLIGIGLYLLHQVLAPRDAAQDASAWVHVQLHRLKDKVERRRAYTGGPQPRTLVAQIGNATVGSARPQITAPLRLVKGNK